MAVDPKLIDDLARRLAARVPDGLRTLRDDLENNFKGVLQGVLGRMDLVSRREFDVQVAVLERTREKLAELTERIVALDKKVDT